MSEIEKKALALLNEICAEQGAPRSKVLERDYNRLTEALCRAIEQREAFKQEVSDVVTRFWPAKMHPAEFQRFVLPKPDPLADVLTECDWLNSPTLAADIREGLAKRGLMIVETGQ